MREEVKAHLLRAADHIRKVGWHQGSYYKFSVLPEGLTENEEIDLRHTIPCCVLGALQVTCGDDDSYSYHVALCDALNAVLPLSTSIPQWNDEIAKDADEVVATLEAAANG